LADLSKLGVLYKNPVTEKYSLGLKLFELGGRVALKSAFVDKTHPELVKVVGSISETVHIAILKNHQVFYVDKVESPQGLKISSHIGSYNPVYATALGKTLLAFQSKEKQEQTIKATMKLQRPTAFTKHTIVDPKAFATELEGIKEKGYGIDREEFELGLICVAIPILNQNDEVIASLSASGPANRFEEEKVNQYVDILKTGADAIQQKIGFFRP